MDDRGLFFSSWSVVTASSSRLPRPQPGAIHRRDIDARRQKITCPAASRSSGAVGFGMDSMEPRLPSRGSPISSPRPHPFGMAWPGESSFLVPVSCQPSQILEGLLTMPSRRVLVPGDPRSRWETCSRGERGRKFWMDRLPGLIKCPTRVLCPVLPRPRCLGRGTLPLPGFRTQQRLHPGKNIKCHRLATMNLQPVIDGSQRCPCLVAVPRCDSHLSQQHAGAFAFIMLCARLVPGSRTTPS